MNQSLSYKEKMQVVAMSATVGNLEEVSRFLDAELFTESFRPVKLVEHIVVGSDVLEVRGTGASAVEERYYSILPEDNFLNVSYSRFVFTRKTEVATKEARAIDEEGVAALVMEAFPAHSVLVFCDSKKRCENVAGMLVNVIQFDVEAVDRVKMVKEKERSALLSSISALTPGFICPTLRHTIPFGIAYHHSGLTADERKIIEEGFLEGTIGVLACTSTLAAGVNLPARRVILRSPYMGRNLLTHGQYKQMVGRAGRAGLDTFGESFLMLKSSARVSKIAEQVVASPVEHCISSLHNSEGRGLPNLILNCLHLGLVTTPGQVNQLLSLSLLAKQANKLSVEVSKIAGAALQSLLSRGLVVPSEEGEATQQIVDSTTTIKPSRLGRAVVAGNVDLGWTEQLYKDLKDARPGLAVDTSLHLLFLITPYDLADQVYYDPSAFHHIFLALKPAEVCVCRGLGVTEGVMVKLLCGGSATKALKPILSRLYCALILLALWQAESVHEVAQKFQVCRF